MRVTLTGATGFIGGHLLDRLLADGHHVTAVVRNPPDIPLLKARGVTAVRGDVGDSPSLERAMMGSEVAFHLARAKAHGSRPREVFEVNVDGTRNVARAAVKAGVARLVHCSSFAVYGSRTGLVDENSPLRPDSEYGRSKVRGESVLTKECAGRVAPVIARITAVLGPRCMSWLPLFRSAASGRLRLVGDGSNMHHPADVSDIVDGLVRCAFVPGAAGNTYNLASAEPVSIAELRSIMAEAANDMRSSSDGAAMKGVGRQPRPYSRVVLDLYYHLGRASDKLLGLRPPLFESVVFLTGDRVLDITRARRELGYDPKFGVREAARRTAEWYRREGAL